MTGQLLEVAFKNGIESIQYAYEQKSSDSIKYCFLHGINAIRDVYLKSK